MLVGFYQEGGDRQRFSRMLAKDWSEEYLEDFIAN